MTQHNCCHKAHASYVTLTFHTVTASQNTGGPVRPCCQNVNILGCWGKWRIILHTTSLKSKNNKNSSCHLNGNDNDFHLNCKVNNTS